MADRLTLRNLYLYLVCLITLTISIFAAVSLVRSTVELLYPDPGYYISEPMRDGRELSEEERRLEREFARESQRRQAVLGLVGAGTTLLITGPVYLYHWGRVRTELQPRGPIQTYGSDPPEPSESPPKARA